MSRSDTADGSITSRAEFEQEVTELVTTADGDDVRIEGAYEVQAANGRHLRVEISEVPPPRRVSRGAAGRERRATDLGPVDVTTRVSLAQVLTGLPLDGPGEDATCSECARELVDGSVITGMASKPIEGFHWHVTEVYCDECSVDRLQSTAFGVTSCLFSATVAEALTAAKQRGWRVPSDVGIVDYSPPSEGST